MKVVWGILVALVLMSPAWAQEPGAGEKKQEGSLEERVGKLEKQLQEQKTTWDANKMLNFASPDGNFTAKIGGRFYSTYRHIFDRDDEVGSADSFNVDTARISLDGTFYKDFFYKLEGEMQNHTDSGRLKGTDLFMGWNALPDGALSVVAGQMKTPWSQEETTSSRFIDFAERSILNRAAPGRDIGLLFKGAFMEKMIEWNLGLFNGSTSRETLKNAADNNDEKDLVGRLFLSPFKTSDAAAAKGLRLGYDFTAGDRDDVTFGGYTAGDLGGTTVNPLAFGGGATIDGLQTRHLFNFSWLYGPASVRFEYGLVNYELNDAALASDFEVRTYYLAGTCLLTGEEKSLETRVKPINNLNPTEGKWGAVELAARIGMMDTSDGEDAGLVAATTNQETTEIAFGVNWWWTPNVALRVNWERFSFDEDLAIGSGNSLEDSQDVFYVRWQIDF